MGPSTQHFLGVFIVWRKVGGHLAGLAATFIAVEKRTRPVVLEVFLKVMIGWQNQLGTIGKFQNRLPSGGRRLVSPLCLGRDVTSRAERGGA